MDFLIEKVFLEFQRSLNKLLEKHDTEIHTLHVKDSGIKKELKEEMEKLRNELHEIRIQAEGTKWKTFMAITVGICGGQGVEEVVKYFI